MEVPSSLMTLACDKPTNCHLPERGCVVCLWAPVPSPTDSHSTVVLNYCSYMDGKVWVGQVWAFLLCIPRFDFSESIYFQVNFRINFSGSPISQEVKFWQGFYSIWYHFGKLWPPNTKTYDSWTSDSISFNWVIFSVLQFLYRSLIFLKKSLSTLMLL